MALMSSNLGELKIQLNIAENYTEEDQYTIYPGKTRIVQLTTAVKN